MEHDLNSVRPTRDDKITLDISPIRRAQDAFALGRYLCRYTHWPYFHMISLANERATFITTRDGWRCLQEALETHQDGMLCITSIDGNSINLRMISTGPLRAPEDASPKSPVEDDSE